MGEQTGIIEKQMQNDIIQLVCFVFSGEEYAVEMLNVCEVIRVPEIVAVPQMPDFTLGVINIRGSIFPVFDLRKKFGLKEKDLDNESKLLIVEVDGLSISFIVDKILDNIKIAKSSIDPSPHVKMNINRECIKGLGQIENRMIIILDLHQLSESINKDILEISQEK